jgi:hypothetical protein
VIPWLTRSATNFRWSARGARRYQGCPTRRLHCPARLLSSYAVKIASMNGNACYRLRIAASPRRTTPKKRSVNVSSWRSFPCPSSASRITGWRKRRTQQHIQCTRLKSVWSGDEWGWVGERGRSKSHRATTDLEAFSSRVQCPTRYWGRSARSDNRYTRSLADCSWCTQFPLCRRRSGRQKGSVRFPGDVRRGGCRSVSDL